MDGRMASCGIDVPFQLIQYTMVTLHSMFFRSLFFRNDSLPQVTSRGYADRIAPIKRLAATHHTLCKHDVTADLSPSDTTGNHKLYVRKTMHAPFFWV
jgi:hypothetical protein